MASADVCTVLYDLTKPGSQPPPPGWFDFPRPSAGPVACTYSSLPCRPRISPWRRAAPCFPAMQLVNWAANVTLNRRHTCALVCIPRTDGLFKVPAPKYPGPGALLSVGPAVEPDSTRLGDLPGARSRVDGPQGEYNALASLLGYR